MPLVERHLIKRTAPRFATIDAAAFASKTRYHAANYVVRQSVIHDGNYLNSHEMPRRLPDHEAEHEADHEADQALPAKVAQRVLRLLDQNWQRCFAARGSRLAARGRKTPRRPWGVPNCPATRTSNRGASCSSTPFRP